MKNPWIAAVLNLFTFGGGYIYNGRRKAFGAALVLAVLLIRGGEIPIYLTHLVLQQWLVLMAGLVTLQFTFAIDAYKEAGIINSSKN